MTKQNDEHDQIGLGGFLRGLRDLIELVSSLPADDGVASVNKTWRSPSGKLNAMQGWTVRVGVPTRPDPPAGSAGDREEPALDEVREPLVDIFTGPDDLTIICELPGVSEDGIDLAVDKNQIRITAKGNPYVYARTVDLPCAVEPGTLHRTFRHGLLEIHLSKPDGSVAGGGLSHV